MCQLRSIYLPSGRIELTDDVMWVLSGLTFSDNEPVGIPGKL